ncbi:Thi74p [Saccharomyces cerevisiae x Saccharomyces kudriavzevii VIN7]|uniref:Thi74p n=1 Tax=Saccharomyces cerevisiae x Saccharomyces kudriavzevii (strain VIN7) TaxID=1095631 RepID=H0GTD8_SACCK|nr:Thi74p [Saccharomyces cerevisiae x Saccharomyces kudriavzevii VIN7]
MHLTVPLYGEATTPPLFCVCSCTYVDSPFHTFSGERGRLMKVEMNNRGRYITQEARKEAEMYKGHGRVSQGSRRKMNRVGMDVDHMVGILMLAVVVVFWVGASCITNELFETNAYNKPFFLTYLNISSFALYLVPDLSKKFRVRRKAQLGQKDPTLPIYTRESLPELSPLVTAVSSPCSLSSPSIEDLRVKATMRLSLLFCVLWFVANLAANSALSYTTVASSTILSSTSSFFTLFLAVGLRLETFSMKKLLGLFVSLFGIILIVMQSSKQRDSVSASSFFIGNTLALLGSFGYSVYTTLLKYEVSSKSLQLDIKMFLGYVGIFTFLLFWPVLIILDISHLETFELPNDFHTLFLLLLDCIIIFVSDYFWCKALILTSPLVVTIGLTFTIPLAMFADYVWRDASFTSWYIVGVFFIFVSFFLV